MGTRQLVERSAYLKSLGILDIAYASGKYSHLDEEAFEAFVEGCLSIKKGEDSNNLDVSKKLPIGLVRKVKGKVGARRGIGKKSDRRTPVSLALEVHLLTALDLLARGADWSRSEVVNRLVALALRHPSLRAALAKGDPYQTQPSVTNRSTLAQNEPIRVALP